MPPRQSLAGFLATARAALKAPVSQRSSPLTFVVGNESADLDSLCSALLFAYIRSSSPPHSLHIPLSNLPRDDLALRTEMTAVLRHAGLAPADLLTLSELPRDLRPEDTQWLLVDHNCLTGPLAKYAGRIVGCIDHHADEGVVCKGADLRVIEPCGSCASLVVEECRQAWQDLATQSVVDGGGSDALAEDAKLAVIGLAAILSDTINLTAKEKIREKDPRAVAFLEAKMQRRATNGDTNGDTSSDNTINIASSSSYDRAALYREIAAVKEDLTGLGFRDIFRKDYKEWESAGLRLGISAVVQDFDYLLAKADGPAALLAALDAWVRERRLDVAAVMTTSNPAGEFQRHLLVWAPSEHGGRGLAALDRFVAHIAAPLQLQPWRDGLLDHGRERFAWRQMNLAASRKQVAPLLRDALKSD